MERPPKLTMATLTKQFHISSLFAIVLLSITCCSYGISPEKTVRFFIFGDSTVDPGNNNYIKTIPENQANFRPYGKNGFFEEPTGRFSDGRVIVDFIAEYAKMPLIPPYLQRSAQFVHGANFASGGAGVLSETNQGLAINLEKQLSYFQEVKASLIEKLGEAEVREMISEAVYFISIGSNDYMGGYLGNPKMQEAYPPQEYVGMVIGNLTHAIQSLYEKGGRKFGFLSLAPLGCLPALRALNPNQDGGCFDGASTLAHAHNTALAAVLMSLERTLQGFKYCNSNFYNWINDRIHHPSNYGLKEGVVACCGTGPYRGIFSCGGTKAVSEYQVCEDPNDRVWWDSFHPTEKIHEQFAKVLWNGSLDAVGPYTLEGLFSSDMGTTIADLVDKLEDPSFVML